MYKFLAPVTVNSSSASSMISYLVLILPGANTKNSLGVSHYVHSHRRMSPRLCRWRGVEWVL